MSKVSELKQLSIDELQIKMERVNSAHIEINKLAAILEKKQRLLSYEEELIRKQIVAKVCKALQELINADIKSVYYASRDLTEFAFKRKGQTTIEGVCLEDCTYIDLCKGNVVHRVDMSAQHRHRIRLKTIGEERLQEI